MKSGIKTTEFWGRAIVTIMGLLVGSGVVQPEIGQQVTDATNQALPVVQAIIDGVVQLAGIVTAFLLQLRQGKERSDLKNVAMRTSALLKIKHAEGR